MNDNCHNINELMFKPGEEPEENHTRLICVCVWYNNPYFGKVCSHLPGLSKNSQVATTSLPKPWKAMLAAASVKGSTEVCGVATSAKKHRSDPFQQQKLHPPIAYILLTGAANIN